MRLIPAIITRRLQQYRLIRAMGGSAKNGIRMLLTGRSGKFIPVKRRVFRDNWPAA